MTLILTLTLTFTLTLTSALTPTRFEMAKTLGCTACFNPKDHEQPMQQALVG